MKSFHPVGSLIPDPFAAGPAKTRRCRECGIKLDHVAAFCSSICQMRHEERLTVDERPVGESKTCTCGLCKTIRSTP